MPQTEGLCAASGTSLVSDPVVGFRGHEVGVGGHGGRPVRRNREGGGMTDPEIVGPESPVPGTWTKYIVVGGAGFIGAHFVDRLLGDPRIEQVTVYENFTSDGMGSAKPIADDRRLDVVRGEVGDLELLVDIMTGHEVAIHLASNPDIALGGN